MKIALIGSDSFIARSLIEYMEGGIEFIQINRSNYNFPTLSFQNGFDFTQLDDCDGIIHCVAAGVQAGHSFSENEIMSINLMEPIALINQLIKNDFKGQLITFGSYFELGEYWDGKTPVREVEMMEGYASTNSYILSKGLLTNFINRRNSKLHHVHLVLTNIYGPKESDQRLLTYLFRGAIMEEKLSFSSGEQVRQFTHVQDVARGIELILSTKGSGIYNFTNPESMTVRDFIMIALNHAELKIGKKIDYTFGDIVKRDSGMHELALDHTKFESDFGFLSYTTIHNGFHTYNELLSNG